jgi:enamine deaminase RidA (YjgF/YER057c/UK114 family)
MIRILSLAAALAVLPLSTALAGDEPKTPSEAAIEAAAEAFEARMETFGERAEAISEAPGLTDAQRQTQIAALWSEYQPEVTAFTATVTQHAGEIAQAALANIDVEALVSQALNDPEVKAAMDQGVAAGTGIARNSAWTNPDEEQLRTYGLIAQYALDQASDAVEDADDAEDAAAEAADEAETPAPH